MIVRADAPFCLRVLGPVTVRADADGASSSRLTQPRHLALLCYLLLARPRGLHARDALIALLWPELDDRRGRQALRNALHGIRRALGPLAILSVGEGLVGVDPAQVRCDVFDLERDIAVDHADASLEPFHGFHVAGAAAFDRWLSREQARLRALQANAAQRVRRTAQRAVPRDGTRPVADANQRHDTYALYVRGLYLFLRSAHGGSTDELLRSREYFERALALDAGFAPAIAGMSNFYAVAARREVLTPFHDTFAMAIACSHEALALDRTLAIPYVHFGVEALYLKDDFDAAGRAFAQAVANEPNYAEGHRFYGVWLGLASRHADALAAMESAVRLEPDIPHMLSSLAAARLAVGDAIGAEQVLRQTLLLDPRHAPARDRFLRVLESQSRFEEALAERLRAPVIRGAPAFETAWQADGAAGYEAARIAELRELMGTLESKLLEQSPPTVADIFNPPVVRLVSTLAQLGELRKARSWRLQACASRPALAPWFASLPDLRRAAVDRL